MTSTDLDKTGLGKLPRLGMRHKRAILLDVSIAQEIKLRWGGGGFRCFFSKFQRPNINSGGNQLAWRFGYATPIITSEVT